jgi:hypothetical protein
VQRELCCLFQSEDGSASWIHPILAMGVEGNGHGVTLLLEHCSRVRNLLAILDNVRVMRTESMSTWSANRTPHTSRMSVISRYRYVRLRRGLHCLTSLLQSRRATCSTASAVTSSSTKAGRDPQSSITEGSQTLDSGCLDCNTSLTVSPVFASMSSGSITPPISREVRCLTALRSLP